jgi:proteasome lid subunit RPN8/RPN11
MTTTIVVGDDLAIQLLKLATADVESGGVIFARIATAANGDIRLFANELWDVPDEAYERREQDELLISSSGYVPALAIAEASQSIPIWFHTHPGVGSSPRSSRHDRKVDEQIADVFRLRADSPYYGALIVSASESGIEFVGHLDDGKSTITIDRLLVVGDRWALKASFDTNAEPLPDLFDRNIRAFGGDVQRTLSSLRVAVVGCGGTGSSVSEQLVRLGVRDLTLIDPETLTASNVTRVYGSTPADIDRPKVDVLGEHLVSIAPDLHLVRIPDVITKETVARRLVGADVIFGCTDDNAGRLVLSRLCAFMMTPVIDCGVLLTTDHAGLLDGIHGRVTLLYPGTACLVCRGRIDLARASAEMLTVDERESRVAEGYAPALGAVEPAVVTFTTAVAAAAVSELLERLTHYGPEPVASETLLRLHDREMSTNRQAPRQGHYCDPSAGKVGRGDTTPFLEQAWAA